MRNAVNKVQETSNTNFDLFRLTKSKEVVDICPNTLRAFQRQGLRFYRSGKAVFISKSELSAFIKSQPA